MATAQVVLLFDEHQIAKFATDLSLKTNARTVRRLKASIFHFRESLLGNNSEQQVASVRNANDRKEVSGIRYRSVKKGEVGK